MTLLEHYVIYHLQQATSLFSIYWLVFVLIVGATEASAWVARWQARRARSDDDINDKLTVALGTASLGLLALLIAFTYSMSLSRYDARRQVVLDEANAIGSTANFALMLPKAFQASILAELRDYTTIRLHLGVPYDPSRFASDIKTGTSLQVKLWQQAVSLTAAEPQSLPVYRFVASLNEMNNIAEKRVIALRNHVPEVVLLVLVGTAMVAMGFTGYSAGAGVVKRRFATLIMALTISFLIVLTIDLQRPDRGTIEVPTTALSDALDGIPAGDPPQPGTP